MYVVSARYSSDLSEILFKSKLLLSFDKSRSMRFEKLGLLHIAHIPSSVTLQFDMFRIVSYKPKGKFNEQTDIHTHQLAALTLVRYLLILKNTILSSVIASTFIAKFKSFRFKEFLL